MAEGQVAGGEVSLTTAKAPGFDNVDIVEDAVAETRVLKVTANVTALIAVHVDVNSVDFDKHCTDHTHIRAHTHARARALTHTHTHTHTVESLNHQVR